MTARASFKQDTIATIRGGKKSGTDRLESWKFWEIVGEMTWRGADRFQAEDIARWCGRAEPGLEKSIPVAGAPEISVKIRRNTKPEG